MDYELWELINVVPSSSFAYDWNETVERVYNRDVAKVQIEFRTAYIRLGKKHEHCLRRLSEKVPRQLNRRSRKVAQRPFRVKKPAGLTRVSGAIGRMPAAGGSTP